MSRAAPAAHPAARPAARPSAPATGPDHPPPEVVAALRTRGLCDALSRWRPLSGGLTNRLWLLAENGRKLVCKLYRPDAATPLFPNDARAEERVLKHLAGTGLAPEPVATLATGSGPCLVYRHVSGASMPAASVAGARALRRLHRQAPAPGLRRLACGPAALQRQGLAMLSMCDDRQAERIRRQMPDGFDLPAVRPVLLHGDPVPGNIIAAPSGVTFIDWQCPAIGDACEDLAIFLSPAMHLLYGDAGRRAPPLEALLAAYGDGEVGRRLERLLPWFHWRMAAYCLWKAERGQPACREGQERELAALAALSLRRPPAARSPRP